MERISKASLERAVRAVEARAAADPAFRRLAVGDPRGVLSQFLELGETEEGLLKVIRHVPPFQLQGGFPTVSPHQRRQAEMDGVVAHLFS